MELSTAVKFRPAEPTALRMIKGEVEEYQLKAESKEAYEKRRKNIRKPGHVSNIRSSRRIKHREA